MKRLLSILLTCVITIVTAVISVSAEEIYYPCYVGTWINNDPGNSIELIIKSADGDSMAFYFRYAQFAVDVDDAKISGTKVSGGYYEVWDEGDYIAKGTITLDLGDSGIWLDWHGYENGIDRGTQGFMMYNRSFKYETVHENNDTDENPVSSEAAVQTEPEAVQEVYEPIYVNLNGDPVSFDVPPMIINERTMVPMRAIFEAMGYTVDWNEAAAEITAINPNVPFIAGFKPQTDGTWTPDIQYRKNKIVMHIGSTVLYQNEDEKNFDTAPIIIEGRTLVPVRAVSEASGYTVEWDEHTRTVNLIWE